MRLKWIAICCLLGFIVVLDPTPTPAQFGRKGGDFGGKGSDFGGRRVEFGKGGGTFPGGGGFQGGGFPGRGNFGGPAPAAPVAPVQVDKPVVLYGAGGAVPGDKPVVMMNSSGGMMYTAPAGGGYQVGSTQGGGFPGGGPSFSGGRPSFGGGSPSFGGGGPGSFGGPGGGRGPMGGDPAAMWERISRGQNSINLNDPEFSRTRGFMERMGTPIPANGILTKEAYIAGAQQRMAAMGGGSPGGSPGGANFVTLSGSPSPDGRMSFTPGFGGDRGGFNPGGGPGGQGGDRGAERLREQDKDNDGRVSRAEADRQLQPNFDRIDRSGDGFVTLEEYRGYYAERERERGNDRGNDRGSFGGNWGGGGPGGPGGGWGGDMGGWGNRPDMRRDNQEEPKPVAIRYGHLPRELPDWFDEYDATRDGQVALHEWRKAGQTIESFATYDLDGDQLITPDEVLRQGRSQSEARRLAAIEDGTAGSRSFGGRGPGGRGPGGRGPGSFGPGGNSNSQGIALPGSSPDASLSPERDRKGGRDGERNSEKRFEKPEKPEKNSEKNASEREEKAGSNGRWGNAGKPRN